MSNDTKLCLFNANCVHFQALGGELSNIRSQLSSLHREISTNRCLSDMTPVSRLNTDCTDMKANLDRVRHLVDEQNRILRAIWEEDQRRILAEQSAFKKQVIRLYCRVYEPIVPYIDLRKKIDLQIYIITLNFNKYLRCNHSNGKIYN